MNSRKVANSQACTLCTLARRLGGRPEPKTLTPAHILGILTLLALAGGFLVWKIPFLKPWANYLEALCFSATFLFHMIPAITDAMLRLPVGDPMATTIEDPRIRGFYLLFLVMFVVGYALQVRKIRAEVTQA